ncbi:protein O-mannosyl-transferase family [Empedobacter brevis]|uniref:protein O-mannosyl-transferase family n=1 Tax=Empedobacter brevis TaxID=247 RepID=UPI003003E54E
MLLLIFYIKILQFSFIKFPFINPIEIGRWVNIISAVIVLNLLFIILKIVTKKYWISLAGTIAFGFSFTFWKNTENIEVYTFSLIWISLYLLFAIKFIQNKQSKILFLAGITLGISLFSHMQGILLFPSYFYLCYLAYKENIKYYLVISYFSIPCLFLSLLFLYPIVNNESLKSVLSSPNKSWVTDSLEKDFINYLKDLIKAIGYIIYNFWWLNLALFFIPFKTFIKDKTMLFLVFFGLPVFGFSTIYAVSDNYVFFLNFNLSYLIILCVGLNSFITKYTKYTTLIFLLIFSIPLYYYSTKQLILQTKKGKEFHQQKAYKDGLNYYLLPWMNNNKGIIEVIINKEETNEDIDWMRETAQQLIDIKSKTMTTEEIKKL